MSGGDPADDEPFGSGSALGEYGRRGRLFGFGAGWAPAALSGRGRLTCDRCVRRPIVALVRRFAHPGLAFDFEVGIQSLPCGRDTERGAHRFGDPALLANHAT